MTTLTISARNLNPRVNYKQFDDIKLNNPLFTIRNIEEEVKNLKTKEEIKKAKKILKKTIIYATSILTMIAFHQFESTSTALASTNIGVGTEMDSIMVNNNPEIQPMDITPDKVMKWGLNLAIVALGVSMGSAMFLFVVTGIVGQFKKRKMASQWGSDIIRGFVQSLIAIPLIYALFYLAVSLFGNFEFFKGIM